MPQNYDIGDLVQLSAAFGEIGIPFTASAADDTFTAASHGLNDNDPVVFSGDLLPSNIEAGRTYHVVSAATHTFQVSETPGGTAVDLAGSGRGEVSKLVDPTTVIVRWRAPDGTVTAKQHVTDSEVVKDDVGRYHIDVAIDAAGTWTYRWESTGPGQGAEEETFFVRKQRVS